VHSDSDQLDENQIRELLNSRTWYHRYEILPGIETPGSSIFNPSQRLDGVGVPSDLTNLRALDVGTWDGPVAFELEKRGATVTAIDIHDADHSGFGIARRILKSKVEYIQTSVYDVGDEVPGQFDLVFFFGVYYHLKHPLLAFEALANKLVEGGKLYFEGEIVLGYAEALGGKPVSRAEAAFLSQTEVPLLLFYPGHFKGASNWAIPNLAGLKSLLQATGLELVNYECWTDSTVSPQGQRLIGEARKIATAVEEHPVVGETMWSS